MDEKNLTIGEIVAEYLQRHGHDGLYHDDCGCEIADLFPCGQPSEYCSAGYRRGAGDREDCDFIIGPDKEDDHE